MPPQRDDMLVLHAISSAAPAGPHAFGVFCSARMAGLLGSLVPWHPPITNALVTNDSISTAFRIESPDSNSLNAGCCNR